MVMLNVYVVRNTAAANVRLGLAGRTVQWLCMAHSWYLPSFLMQLDSLLTVRWTTYGSSCPDLVIV